jgi:hypothetical protein
MWTAIAAVASLLIAIFAWWVKATDETKKKKAAEDAKIDSLTTADDIMRGDK